MLYAVPRSDLINTRNWWYQWFWWFIAGELASLNKEILFTEMDILVNSYDWLIDQLKDLHSVSGAHTGFWVSDMNITA